MFSIELAILNVLWSNCQNKIQYSEIQNIEQLPKKQKKKIGITQRRQLWLIVNPPAQADMRLGVKWKPV